MPDVGTNQTTNFNESSRIVLDDGSSEHTVAKYVEGSFSITQGGRTTYPEKVNGDYNGDVHVQGEQETTIRFAFMFSADNYDEVMAVASPADASGKKTLFDLHIDHYDFDGATTGRRHTYADCYVPAGGIQHDDAGDGAIDAVALTIQSLTTEPTITDIGA